MTVSAPLLPNSYSAIQRRFAHSLLPSWRPYGMLIFRLVGFAFWQVIIALVYGLQSHPSPWEASTAWWPVTATATNILTLAVLAWVSKQEGMTLRDLYRVEAHVIKRELLIVAGLLVIGGPLGFLPNILLGNWLFGDIQLAGEMFIHPLPLIVIIPCLVLFPLTNALAELPNYYSYALPRLITISGHVWTSVMIAAFWLAAQHITLPLIFDARFLLWRLGMFLPFALFVGICLYKRPRLLPYFMVVHGLMDLQIAVMVLTAS